MKRTYLLPVLLFMATCLFAQKEDADHYFNLKPMEIRANTSGNQTYDVSMKWQNLDAINGNRINCNLAKANYIYDAENMSVRWKDVATGQIQDFNHTEYQLMALPAFNDFSYTVNDTNFLKADFYKVIPAAQKDLAKWLVSDAIQMQGLAWYVFDSLEFNKAYIPEILNNYDVKFENWAVFTSRYQKLIWTGITKHNNKICAIVKFESLYNPVKIENEQMSVKGRSLYYGEMWISLKDKQVEYSLMVEDVVMKLKSPMFPKEQLIDLQREIVFDKIK